VRLTADLQRSRERLVTAREEERRRLRRDLHDGLGPALASLTLKLDAARNLLARDPAATGALLLELKTQTQTAIADIRRLVYDLRPPALDELGLISAIREHAARDVSATGLHVSVEAPDHLPPLPAAVEVAAYRIALEAMTNVVRHAHARQCVIRLSLADALQLEIMDDGLGLAAGRPAGVGLHSMRERAAELGGTCVIGPGPGGGTRVVARLPLSQDL
jgi:signal transduction histidine kinase